MKFGDIHEINSVLQQIQNEEKNKVVESCGCGCGTKEECTCGPECSNCECHNESVEEVAQHGTTEYYRELDKGQLNHTKSMLMKTAGQLNVAIEQRYKFSKELMGGTGDRAGTGDLQKMLDTLNNIIGEWDEETKLYGK